MHACESAEAHGARKLGIARSAAYSAYIESEIERLRRTGGLEALREMDATDLCRRRFLYYRGDDNYGLGNVLYDVAAAAAVALVLNRTLVYAADAADRKFGSLLRWPGIPTMQDINGLQRRAKCSAHISASTRRVVLAPDRCTFQKSWRKERRGEGKCLR